MDIEMDEKELIKELIRGELSERGSSIDQVKEVIRNEIGKRRSVSQQLTDETGEKQHVEVSLGPIDVAFINQKYIEYCFDLWVQEVGNFLTNYYRRKDDCATENLNYDILEDLLNSFDTIQNLRQIPEPLNQLQYYARLMENRRLISENNQKIFVRKFKSICSEQIVNCVEFVQTELDFLKAFVDFLLASRSMQEIVRKLQLQSFCSGDLPFDKLTEGIMNLQVNASETELLVLREAVHCLKEEKALFLTKTFRRVIKDYIEPVKIEEKTLDGRSVIETTGKSIVLTEILPKLETLLSSNSDIAELRIVGADILHIDANLENLQWHGKNVVILAKIMKIHDKVTWDVSGKHNDHTYSGHAGTEVDGHGKRGADGYAGESGGNISILADEIKNPENFTIISHGGNGSKGQDGGNGIDGKDGKGMTIAEFKESFPSVVTFLYKRLERGRLFDITVANITRPATVVKTHWSVDGDEFIEAKTIHGNEITFSYSRAATFTCLQALLLCKGSSGQPGACGGECGLGGEGGYSGQITTNNPKIVEHADRGKPGGNGKGGLHGDPGRNGWDVGYTDYQHWPTAEIYGTDKRSKLQLKYHDTTWGKAPSDSIWCPYYAKYGQIAASQLGHVEIQKYQERMNTRQNMVLQHQARAKRMKSIPLGRIVADYSFCYSSIGRDVLQNTQSTFDDIMNRALQALVDNAEQQEKVTTELNVKHVKSTRPVGSNHRYKTAARTSDYNSRNLTNKNIIDIESLIMLLSNDSAEDNEYSAFRSEELSRSDLDRFITDFERMSVKCPENEKKRNIEQLLHEKYRCAILREVTNRLPDYDNNSNNPVMNLESARYLIVAKENDNQISHNILGTLSQYLFVDGTEQREKISRFFHEELRNSRDNKPLQRSVGTFVLKEIRSEQVNSSIGRHKVEYEKFLEKKFQSLKTFWEPFRRVLVQDKYRDIFALWIKRGDGESSRCHLNREIQKDEFLNALYNLFNRQLTKSFDWNKCCTDKDFLQEYTDDIRERGPFSESYRELLAYVFHVNIKLYEGRGNQFHMTYNHSPSSEKTVHVLYRENELKQLNIDKDHLRLEEQHTKMGKIYAEVLAETEKLNKKQELDDYLEHKTFSTDDTWEICLSENNGERQENPCKFCMEELESTDNQDLKRSMRTFVLEVGESQKIHPDVKKHYEKFKKFSKEQERSLIIFFEPFYGELKRHKHIHALWAANHENKCSTGELEKEMKQYDLLNALHQRFQHQFKQEYDWNECCENKHVLREFYRHVDQKGQPPGRCSDLRHQFIDEYTKKEEERTLRDDPCTQIFPTNNMFKLEEESDYFLERQILHLDINLSDREYRDCEEQDIGNIIKHFSCPEERLQIKERLEKISFQYIGHRGILNNISRRFSNDGRHVSFQELCCLVNSILTSVIQGRKQQNVFCWIVAAYPQNCWIDEVVLLQLENYFRKQLPAKSNWRAYLSGITDKAILLSLTLKLNRHKSNSDIAPQCIEDALKLLSYMPNEAVSLERLDLREWPDALKEKYWVCKLSQLANWPDSESLSEASYYLSSMENTFGTPLVEKLMEIVESKEDVVPEALTTILSNFYNERCNLDTQELETLSSCRFGEWVKKTGVRADRTDRDVTLLVELIKGNANTSKNISDKLPEIESSIISISTKDPVVGPPASRVKRTYEWVKRIPNVLQGTLSKLPALETAVPNGVAKGTWAVFSQWIKGPNTISQKTLDESPKIKTPLDHFREQVAVITEMPENRITEEECKIYSLMCRRFFDYCRNMNEKKEFIEHTRISVLAVVDKAIRLKRGFKLRDTQKLAILALLTNENDTLAQVSTGEGKSLIVVAASIMKAIFREKVDIITSSSVLAKRDAKDNRDIYKLFGISVSHNCTEDIEKRRQAYSKSEVVYGDLSNFQRDYLLDKFYERNILGDRTFENIFVDEVDSMLLDKGNNMLYLSHDLPGLDKLESLFVYIWQWVNRPAKSQRDLSSNFDIGAIKKAVLKELFGLITKEDIKKLDSELDDQQATIILNRLIAAEILDDQGKMLRGNIDDSRLEIILAPQFNNYKNRLRYLLDECIQRTKSIHVPNCFTAFIQQHLEVWIDSAVKAAVMQEGHQYVLDVDRTGTSQDINPCITIVDKDTGTDQANSQWDEALHQFLQLKHGCKLSLQSLKAVYISNVSYLKYYKNLYGVTGTLGSRIERKFLTEIHKIDFITIPTAKPKQFQEERPILCNDKAKWLEEIYTEARRITKSRNRSVLIICETINDAETLKTYFLSKRTKNVHTYTRDYEEFDITQGTKKLERGQIIIATNLSGRGTDIRITEELRIAGGLHICLTYLPTNSRIEQQAFGRAARSGDKGSGRLIIKSLDGQEYSKGKILDLKKQRDVEELHRVSDLKAYYETQIITEETFFKEFTTQYRALSDNLSRQRVSDEVKGILMHSCLDKWAFWLDRNIKYMENVTHEHDRNTSKVLLNDFICELKNLTNEDHKTWVEEQPVQMIKLGKCFCQTRKYDDAIELFDKVIELEPRFSETAHYYKAFAIVKKIDWSKKALLKQDLQQFEAELREAARLFEEHSKSSMYTAGIIDAIKEHSDKSVIQINSYTEQQTNLSNLYDMFLRSIDDILGKSLTPTSFAGCSSDEALSEIIYEDLLSNGILKKPQIESSISEVVLNKISFDFGITKGELKTCLSAFEGKEMDETEIEKSFKKGINLPSREDFWKMLVQENILNQEVRYIIVDIEKLEKLNPSLLHLLRSQIDNNKLAQKILECSSPNEIILSPEQAGPQQDSNVPSKECYVFEKDDLLEVLADDYEKFEFLKKKRVFMYNKKACIDLTNSASAYFPRYDSITLDDFENANIARTDAEVILAGLVEQKVLQKVDSEDEIYRLVIPFNQIKQIQFPSYPVYQTAVIGLLSLCFVYRMTLERIEEELKEKKNLIYPRLPEKPHHDLIYALMDFNVIGSVKFNTEMKDWRNQLTNLYSETMTSNELELMLARSKLLPKRIVHDEFLKHLVEKEWLYVIETRLDVCETDPLYPFYMEMQSALDIQYSINSIEHRQRLSLYGDIEKTMAKIFNDRLKLAKKETIEQIRRVLKQSRSPLITLEVPDGVLKPVAEHKGMDRTQYIDEINTFTLNGLDQLLEIEENKWTAKMFFNTVILILIGAIQIAAGFLIEAFSKSIRTAIFFVSEGIHDITYAMNLLWSGQFSWRNYLQHKFQRLMSMVVKACTRAFSPIVSLFGSRVVEFTLNLVEEAEETTEQMESNETNDTRTEIANHIISRNINAEVFHLADGGVDVIVRNHLERLCDDIGSAVLSGIKEKIEEHISVSLENTYQVLGEEESMNLVTDLAENLLNERNLTDKYLPIAMRIARSVTQSIENAVQKENQYGKGRHTPLAETIKSVLALVPKVEDSDQVDSVRNITESLLNSLHNKLAQTLVQNAIDQNQEEVQGCESFKKKSIHKLNSSINERVGLIMERHIVGPILNNGGGCLMQYCEKMIKMQHHSYNGDKNNDRLEKLRSQYVEGQRSAHLSVLDYPTEIQTYAVDEYHNNVNELITKTHDYKLLATLVRENVPLDVSCLWACIPVLRRVSETTGLTIVAKERGRKERRFSSFSVEEVMEKFIIHLELVKNRFRLHGAGTLQNNGDGDMKTNCLYETVSDYMNLNMTPESFRAKVANCIERDPDVQYQIKQEWCSSSTSPSALLVSHDMQALLRRRQPASKRSRSVERLTITYRQPIERRSAEI